MKNFDKFSQKYGTNAVILPPPPEDAEEKDPTQLPGDHGLPNIEPLDLEQMERDWFIFDRDQPKIEEMKKRKRDTEERLKELQNTSPTRVVPAPEDDKATLVRRKLSQLQIK